MPTFSSAITDRARRWTRVALGAAVALTGAAALPATAAASHSQLSIIQDGNDLYDPAGTFQQFRELGANTVRVVVPWAQIAPNPTSVRKPSFNATDPNAYPAANWAPFDNIVTTAEQDGLKVYLVVTGGAPRWAEAQAPQGKPNESYVYLAWKPNAREYGQFVQAVGKRYSGGFTPSGASSPLPAVHFWSIFNEPNFGQDLGPQATNDSTVMTGVSMYRSLVNTGWHGLKASGHGRDTILIGELAAEGFEPGRYPKKTGGLPGMYGQTRPLLFMRDLYCVDTGYHQLRGGAARASGCPTNAAGSRRFRSQNPGLFSASGVADHPYPQTESPVSRAGNKVDFARFVDLGNLQATVERAARAYGARRTFPIYNTEYGYITNPPHPRYLSPAKAAYYINWAEYLSWKTRWIASYMQYLLRDPAPTTGIYAGFASGLETSDGKPKATYDAYRMPVYMPHTSFSRRTNAEIWGNVRPAPFMKRDGNGNQFVSIQLNRRTIKTTRVNGGFFDLRMKFPRSGSVRLAWTYPKSDPFLPVGDLGKTVYSRSFRINVH